MKKPPQKLIDAFFNWYHNNPHSKNEDYYRETITRNHLFGLSKSDFIDFFYQFAHEGGKVQSGGYRTSGKFREIVESTYDQFRSFVLKPFDMNFDEAKWLAGTKAFKYFGIGLATIYLNRVDKKRFSILNNKAADSLALFDVTFPSDKVKRYQIVQEAQKQLITWFPQFENYYRADALNQFLIGEEEGQPWKETMGTMSFIPPGETVGTEYRPIWKISHGKVDFNAEQRKTYLEQHTVHVHKDTKKGQGALFASEMKEGDFFYLCHGNDDGIRVVGQITGSAIPSPHDDGWLQRSYAVLFEGVKPSVKYTGIKKGWTPNYNSTCMAVPNEEIKLFESEILIPFFGKRLSDIPGFTGTPPSQIPLPSKNIILYGPPGTGKTYALRNEYMKRFTESQMVTREQFAQEIAGELTWLQVITIVLYDLGPTKVSAVFDHLLLQAKIRLQANQTPKNTIWSWLQRHTKMDCSNVKNAHRDEPLIFSKDEHSVWTVDREMVDEQLPELIDKLKMFREFKPVNKEIKRYEYVTFHQSYCYEDFVEGIKPVMSAEVDETLTYEVKSGIFKKMVKLASDDPNHNYALLIDEINRGNVASIFGELITLIEEDKRKGAPNELRAQLPYSRQEFVVPGNLYIIGAMNTADRSVEALDTALRRRFTFVAFPPQPELVQQPGNLEVDLRRLLIKINARIEKLLDKDHCIGHSYFMGIAKANDPLGELCNIFATKILPLLEDYFYGDPAKIGMVLGDRFVTRKDETIEWAAGDWGMDEFEERRVYALQDPMTLKVEDFRAVYE
jgi:hypothetical protein